MMQELNYIRCGDYYIPDIRLPKETRPIGRWGRMHRDYIKEHNPIRFNDLCLSCSQLLCGSVAENHRDHSLRSDYLPL